MDGNISPREREGVAVNRLALLVVLTVLLPSTAFANNAPRPDGVLSLMFVIPVALIGSHFAGARFNPKRRVARTLGAVGVTILAIVSAGGTIVGLVMLLVVMVYGLNRGIQAIRLGHSRRRYWIGAATIVYSLFAGGDYLTALALWTATESEQDWIVRSNLRTAFGKWRDGALDFGSVDQLELDARGIVEMRHWGPPHYSYIVSATDRPVRADRHLFLYARPHRYGRSDLWSSSLGLALGIQEARFRFTYAIDETGVVRRADLGATRPVTREETKTWIKCDEWRCE
jgi:hypothetical protein